MGNYRPSIAFTDRSNKRAEYMKKIEEITQKSRTEYVGGEYSQCEGMRNLGRCITNVNENQMGFSKRVYGKVLCWNCQPKVGDKHE